MVTFVQTAINPAKIFVNTPKLGNKWTIHIFYKNLKYKDIYFGKYLESRKANSNIKHVIFSQFKCI